MNDSSSNTFLAITGVTFLLYISHISSVLVVSAHDVISETWIGSEFVSLVTGTGYAGVSAIIFVLISVICYFIRKSHGNKIMVLLMMVLLLHVVHMLSLFV
jgi:hypothetical protein